jgi:tRNA nucleotidyltransferase (CCA-adding enzyme)
VIVQNGLMPVAASEIVLERLPDLPGGEALLAVAAKRDDVELVGGAVRDLLLGRTPREIDVVVGDQAVSFADDSALFAEQLCARLNASFSSGAGALASTSEHERFGTVLVAWDGGEIDIATRRAETYAAPGALPDVRAGTEREDLERRDFTVNAIAIRLGGERRGRLRAVPDALSDLERRRLRVLHEQSFDDDPTRLLRMARYGARLGFEVEDHTAALAAKAIAGRALDTVSGARIGAELRLALAEDDSVAALGAIDDLGLLSALHPRLRLDRPIVLGALALLPEDGRRDLLLMAALALPLVLRADGDPGVELSALLDRWEFSAGDRDRVVGAAQAVVRLLHDLCMAESPSQLRAIVGSAPMEGVALAGAHGNAEAARSWFEDVRHVRLEIDGADLIAAGIPEGPEIGQRLEAVLKWRLDGELAGDREAELKVALDLATPEENGAGGPA